jgi:hypothetical protein
VDLREGASDSRMETTGYEETDNLYTSLNIIRIIKTRKMDGRRDGENIILVGNLKRGHLET